MTKKLLYVVLLAMGVRLLALFLLNRHVHPELWEYDTIALNLIQNRGYTIQHLGTTYHIFGYPLYPYFCALVHYLTNKNYLILELIQLVLSSLTVFPLYFMGKKIFNERSGWVSGILFSLHPGIIVYATKLHELTLVIFFMVIIVYLITVPDRHDNVFLTGMGITIGLGMLLRPTFVSVIPAYMVFLCFKLKKVRVVLYKSLVVTLGAFITVMPWLIRNYHLYNRFIFTTTCGEHFWRGNNPQASGSALTVDNIPILSATPPEFQGKVFSLNEIEQYEFFSGVAMEYIKTYPLVFLKNFIKKTRNFWLFSPQTGLTYPKVWFYIYMCFYLPLLLSFLVAVFFIFMRRQRVLYPYGAFCLSLFIIITFIQSLFYVETRHRWAIEPLLLTFSAYGFTSLQGLWIKRKNRFGALVEHGFNK